MRRIEEEAPDWIMRAGDDQFRRLNRAVFLVAVGSTFFLLFCIILTTRFNGLTDTFNFIMVIYVFSGMGVVIGWSIIIVGAIEDLGIRHRKRAFLQPRKPMRLIDNIFWILFPGIVIFFSLIILCFAEVLWFTISVYASIICWVIGFSILVCSFLFYFNSLVNLARSKFPASVIAAAYIVALAVYLGGGLLRGKVWLPHLSKQYVTAEDLDPDLAKVLQGISLYQQPLLKEGTTIEIPVIFTGSYLELVPQGNGYFQVMKTIFPRGTAVPTARLPVFAPSEQATWGPTIHHSSRDTAQIDAKVSWPNDLRVSGPTVIGGIYKVPVYYAHTTSYQAGSGTYTNTKGETQFPGIIVLLPNDQLSEAVPRFFDNLRNVDKLVGVSWGCLFVAVLIASAGTLRVLNRE